MQLIVFKVRTDVQITFCGTSDVDVLKRNVRFHNRKKAWILDYVTNLLLHSPT